MALRDSWSERSTLAPCEEISCTHRNAYSTLGSYSSNYFCYKFNIFVTPGLKVHNSVTTLDRNFAGISFQILMAKTRRIKLDS